MCVVRVVVSFYVHYLIVLMYSWVYVLPFGLQPLSNSGGGGASTKVEFCFVFSVLALAAVRCWCFSCVLVHIKMFA